MSKKILIAALDFKEKLEQCMVNDSYENQVALASASYELYIEAAKKSNIEPDNYLSVLDDVLKPLFNDFKISKSKLALVDRVLQNMSNSTQIEVRQSFHALNLVYCHYLKNNEISEIKQNVLIEFYATKKQIKETLNLIEKEIKLLKKEGNTKKFEQHHKKLKETTEDYLNLPFHQQLDQFDSFQKKMVDLCGEESRELQQIPNAITLKNLFKELITHFQNFLQRHRLLSPHSSHKLFNSRKTYENVEEHLSNLKREINESLPKITSYNQ